MVEDDDHIRKKQKLQTDTDTDTDTNGQHMETDTALALADTTTSQQTVAPPVPLAAMSPSVLSTLPLPALYVLFDLCSLSELTRLSITCRTVSQFLEEIPASYGQYYWKMRAFTQKGEDWYAELIVRHCQPRLVGLRPSEDAAAYEAELLTLTPEERHVERQRDETYCGWSWRQHLIWDAVTSSSSIISTQDVFDKHRTAWIGMMKQRKRKTKEISANNVTNEPGTPTVALPPPDDDDDEEQEEEQNGNINNNTQDEPTPERTDNNNTTKPTTNEDVSMSPNSA